VVGYIFDEHVCMRQRKFIGFLGSSAVQGARRTRSSPSEREGSISCTISGANMRAARIHRFGAPDVVVVEEVPRPAPAAGELLIRVAASGVGP